MKTRLPDLGTTRIEKIVAVIELKWTSKHYGGGDGACGLGAGAARSGR